MTSRLHVASPCIAMGIPVIVVANNFDGRFSWIDKYTHLYTDEEFDKINWEPQVVEIEEEKQQIADMFMNRIKKAYENYNEIYYENRERKAYNTKIVKSLESLNLSKEEKVKYCLWGIIPKTLLVKNIIDEQFKNWELVSVIDENVCGEFEGVKIEKSGVIEQQDEEVIYLVIPTAAHNAAASYLEKLGRRYVLEI